MKCWRKGYLKLYWNCNNQMWMGMACNTRSELADVWAVYSVYFSDSGLHYLCLSVFLSLGRKQMQNLYNAKFNSLMYQLHRNKYSFVNKYLSVYVYTHMDTSIHLCACPHSSIQNMWTSGLRRSSNELEKD